MADLKWRKVGREWHSTDGRFEVYCNSHRSNFYGSFSTWVLIDTAVPGRRRTQLSTREACQAKANDWLASS